MNSDHNPTTADSKPLSNQEISKATSELNNLLQMISGSATEIANLRQNDGSEPYVSILQDSIERAETVAAELAEKAGGTHKKAAINPELAAFATPKNVAAMPMAKPQILAVDDEEVALLLLKQVLSTAGYHVTTAQSGFECLDLFRRRPLSYELVILDLTMPFMDGEETFRRLREIRSDVPVMLCTGFIQNERLEQLLAAGMSGFLRKPFAPDEIAGQVKSIMEGMRYLRASGAIGDTPPLMA